MITRDKLEQRIAALEMAEKQRRDSMTITATVEDFIARRFVRVRVIRTTGHGTIVEAGDCMPVSRYILMHFLRPCGRTHLATES